MSLRDRLWPGLRTRSIWSEAHVAVGTWAGVTLGSTVPVPAPVRQTLLAAGAALLGLLLLFLRRRAPLLPFALSVLLAAAQLEMAAGIPITVYAVARYERSWRIRLLAGVLATLAVAELWDVESMNDAVNAVGFTALLVLLPGALGIWQRTRADLLAALRERAEKAEAERELLARDAVATERTRIAREMHDAVGHRVSLMVLQAGAIEMAARDPERVEVLAGQVQTAGRRALDELREMVGVLRAGDVDEAAPLGPQPGLEDLPRLVEHAREAGMEVALELPERADVDPAVGRAAFRIAQEALTNAGKHAPGAAVTVAVERTADRLAVRVVSGPAEGVPAGTSGEGYGLVGLAERVRTLDGRFTAQHRLDGGFCVEAVLPA